MSCHTTTPRKRRFFFQPAAALAVAALLPACQTTSSRPLYGHTEYLNAVAIPAPQASPQARAYTGPPPDTVSFWDGSQRGGSPRITIKLSEQKAFFYRGSNLVGVSAISSGDSEHRTPTGNFKISQKNSDHRSNLYGDFVDGYGNVVVRDVDSRKDKAPPGTHYRGAAMPYFMRFNGGVGMHAGYLPGYPASHGCVRMPKWMARNFFSNVTVGTPVKVIH